MKDSKYATGPWLNRVGIIAFAAVIGMWALLYMVGNVSAPMRIVQKASICGYNQGFLVRSFRMYSDDYQDSLPPADLWMDRIAFYTTNKRQLHCPTVENNAQANEAIYGYSIIDMLAGKKKATIDETAVLMYDSLAVGRSAHGPVQQWPLNPRHLQKLVKDGKFEKGNIEAHWGGKVVYVPTK